MRLCIQYMEHILTFNNDFDKLLLLIIIITEIFHLSDLQAMFQKLLLS